MTDEKIISFARMIRDGGHWNQLDIISFARMIETHLSYASIHSCGPDCDRPACVNVRRALEDAVKAERNKVAQWMITKGYATGHGDTTEDLLQALGTEIDDRIKAKVKAEREACAKVCEGVRLKGREVFADAIRARGQDE
jgi:hypothetical protein